MSQLPLDPAAREAAMRAALAEAELAIRTGDVPVVPEQQASPPEHAPGEENDSDKGGSR